MPGRKKIIYLAGPIRGISDYQYHFARHAHELRKCGHTVYNPAAANQEGRELHKIMAHLLPQLCECDAIAAMPGWDKSGGASIEVLLARYLGLEVMFLE